MTISSIAPKLSKLIPMLSSDNDGETVAAVRAIDRTLKAAKLDWHDLAKALAAGGGSSSSTGYRSYGAAWEENVHRASEARRRREEAEREAREAADNIRRETEARRREKHKEKIDAINWCLERANRLQAREQEFLESVRSQLLRGSDLSEKQKKWLIDIYDRLKRGR
jgi:flagellar motility protein MotE (MotC chaperone)